MKEGKTGQTSGEVPKGVLEAVEVTKIYGDGRAAVKAVDSASLQLKKGEIVLLMGPSGSGKTTFLSLCGCLLKPTSGKVRINGLEVSSLDERVLPQVRRRNIGFVFQSFNLLSSLTALENVMVVLNLTGISGRQAREKAARVLEELGLGSRQHHLPRDLSGGEKQRVAIARAVVTQPSLILADEPTANLDSKTGHEVMELLCCGVGRDQGRSVLIVSHDPRIKDIADRVLWMEDGRIKDRIP